MKIKTQVYALLIGSYLISLLVAGVVEYCVLWKLTGRPPAISRVILLAIPVSIFGPIALCTGLAAKRGGFFDK
jgi:hypothetical protein